MRGSRAFTLLEAVAAICILGLLAAGIVVAASRLARQEGYAKRKQEAIALADTLLARWHAAGWQVPEPREGQAGTSDQPGLLWSVRRGADAGNLPAGYGTYTLTVAAPDPAHPNQPVTLTQVAFVAMDSMNLPTAGGRP